MNLPKRSQNPPTPVAGIAHLVARFADAPALADLRAAMVAAQADYASVVEAAKRIGADKTLTEGARLVRQAKLARAKMGEAVARLATAKAKVAAAVEHYDSEAAKPFDFADRRFADVNLAAEIRAHFRALPQHDRMTAVAAAMKSNDLTTLVALGAGPAYLGGLPDELHGAVRNTVLAVVAPDAIATRATLADGAAAAEQFEGAVLQSVADLVDFESAAAIERTADAA